MSASHHHSEQIPILWRLMAWWEGYDALDYARMRRPKKMPRRAKKEAEIPQNISPEEARLIIIQKIWGKGFSGPGTAKHIHNLSKLLSLSPQMSALIIGADLGGPARILAQDYGVWLNGYETDPMIAEAAHQMSIDAGLERKAQIVHMNLNKNPVFERNFDRAFSKEAFYLIAEKKDLMQAIFDHLKKGSLFLMTDYVVEDKQAHDHPCITEWQSSEPQDIYLSEEKTLGQLIEKAGFTLRVHEDITDQYITMIEQAWANANTLVRLMVEDKSVHQDNLKIILQEAEVWGQKHKALQSGKLKVCRYLAHKPTH